MVHEKLGCNTPEHFLYATSIGWARTGPARWSCDGGDTTTEWRHSVVIFMIFEMDVEGLATAIYKYQYAL